MAREALKTRHASARGFTLIEVAVVIMIIALLLGGLIATLSAQFDARSATQTEQTMQLARDALIGFAVRQGRLPCPAIDSSAVGYRDGTSTTVQGTGEEAMRLTSSGPSPASAVNGSCAATVGYFPALSLGVGPTDAQGYLIDGWGSRVLYAVSGSPGTDPRDFTTANRLRTLGFAATPNLFVCTSAPTNKPTDCGVPGTRVPAVIISRGKNFSQVAVGEEAENNDFADNFFVAHTPGPSFDDQLLWLSENVLYSRMISASGF
jgi:prepilin-type N-terminal cleavage/methylation domain-containing protein